MTPGVSFTFTKENEEAKEHQTLIGGHPLSRRMRETTLRGPISRVPLCLTRRGTA